MDVIVKENDNVSEDKFVFRVEVVEFVLVFFESDVLSKKIFFYFVLE